MALNTRPFEVIGAALFAYVAPPLTARPAIDAAPVGDWTLVGTSGPLNYDEDGVTVEHPQSFNFWRSLAEAGSRKAFRTEEDLKYGLMLVDVTLEQYRLALNGNAVTTTPADVGVAGVKKLGLSRGVTVDTVALLVRGPSPYVENGNAQYWTPIAVQTGSPAPNYKRSDPAMLQLEWTALVNPDAIDESERFGVFEAQTADALT